MIPPTEKTLALFDGFEAEPVEKLSPDRRRTMRQRAQVKAGFHPLTGSKTHPEWGTCGDCRWRVLAPHHNRTYPKCAHPLTDSGDVYEMLGPQRATHSAASDVRAWWPACDDFDRGDNKISRDAARWTP